MARILDYRNVSEMPPVPVSLGDMKWSKTGTWRYMRPTYEDKTPPCNQACPAGIDIVRFLMLLETGKITDAWLKIKEENPFPGVCGRVCPHPCETECNRAQYDQPIAISGLERFVADQRRRTKSHHPDRNEKRSEKIAIVGSGPAGLSCGYHLARLGYDPEVFEALPVPEGILRVGIPEYRLPHSVLNAEIADIEAIGVRIHTDARIENGFLDNQGKGYQAIFIATGAHKSQGLSIPEEEGAEVIPGLAFLRDIRMNPRARPMGRVAVIGGGNTALDVARSALRLGSRPLILYRRGMGEMPAFAEEIEETQEEGIDIEFLTQPVRIIRENGRVRGLECVRMRLGKKDESGRRSPIPIEDSNFTLDVDQVIVAIGEAPNTDLVKAWGPLALEDLSGLESRGIFLGGDLVSPLRTVAHAIGSGKRAAIAIDAFLTKREPSQALETSRIGETGGVSMRKYLDLEYSELSRHVVSFEEINTAYFRLMERAETRRIKASRRIRDFREVKRGLGRREARHEAARCFNCGTCNECENCYVFCPDVSILKNTRKLKHAIDYDYCKGCGICFTECPRNAISMVEERR